MRWTDPSAGLHPQFAENCAVQHKGNNPEWIQQHHTPTWAGACASFLMQHNWTLNPCYRSCTPRPISRHGSNDGSHWEDLGSQLTTGAVTLALMPDERYSFPALLFAAQESVHLLPLALGYS